MPKLLFLVIFLMVFNPANARESVQIISDVDGTIRQTHVRAKGFELVQLLLQAVHPDNSFSGLPELYRELNGSADDQCFDLNRIHPLQDYEINYVTAAPAFLRALGRRFLKVSCFPLGDYYPRRSLFDNSSEFKFHTISSILKESGARNVLLFGDNGQKDPEVYYRIEQEVAKDQGIEITTFIHMVYSHPVGAELKPGQLAYLTGADLAAQLFELDWISEEVFTLVVNKVYADLTSPASYHRVFPSWVSCEEFARRFRWPDLDYEPGIRAKLEVIDQAMGERCLGTAAEEIPALSGAELPSIVPEALQCAELLHSPLN